MLTVLNSLKGEIDISSLYAWSNSKVSLAWIKSCNKEFVTFVQNRVVEIRKNVSSEKWSFDYTKLNPVDFITRLEKYINLTKNYSREVLVFCLKKIKITVKLMTVRIKSVS